MAKRFPLYKVYEVSKEYRKHGRLLKTFRDRKRAERFMEKNIYRYIREDVLLTD